MPLALQKSGFNLARNSSKTANSVGAGHALRLQKFLENPNVQKQNTKPI
jgi:hypothetical protein